MKIKIERFHLKDKKPIELTEYEIGLLKFMNEKVRKNINEYNCFVHKISIHDIIIQLIDDVPNVTVFACCPTFGQILASKMEKENIPINCAYVKVTGTPSQN